MNEVELEKFHKLKDKWKESQRRGDFSDFSTKELEEVLDYFKKAESGLTFFPECQSTLCWIRLQMHPIKGYIETRRKKS